MVCQQGLFRQLDLCPDGRPAAKVTAQLCVTAENESKPTVKLQLYSVRKSWADSKSQKGAYTILDNAKKCANVNPCFSVFDADGKVVYPTNTQEAADTPFRVEVSILNLDIRIGPGTNFPRTGVFIDSGIFTITAAQSGQGPDLPAEASSNPASDGFRWAMQSVYN